MAAQNPIRNKFIFFDTEAKFNARLAAEDIPSSSIVFVYEEKQNADDVAFIYAQGKKWETNFIFHPNEDIGFGTESDTSENTGVSVTTTNGVVTNVSVSDIYIADSTTNYLKNASSLKDADKKLDTQIKANADAIAGLDTKLTILDADVIDASPVTGTGTTLEVKVDETTIDKEYISGNSGLKRLKSVIKLGWNSSTKEIELQNKNGVKIGNGLSLGQMIGDNSIISRTEYNSSTGILTINFAGSNTPLEISLVDLIDVNDAGVKSGSDNYLEVGLKTGDQYDEDGDPVKQFQVGAKICNLSNAAAASGNTDAVTGLADSLDTKTYIDGAISTLTSDSIKKVNGDSYVSVSAPSSREQSITTNISTLSRNTTTNRLTGGTANHLVDAANLQTQVNAVIDNLDKSSTSISSTAMTGTPTSPGFVKLTYSEDAGIVSVDGLEIKVGDLNPQSGDPVEGLATVSDVVTYVDDITGGANQWKPGTGTDSAILKGSTSTSTGQHTITGGTGNTNNGNNSIAGGTSNTNSGNNSVVGGTGNSISTGISDSLAVGSYLETLNSGEAAFGVFNDSVTHATNASGQTLFSVGIGTSTAARANAIEIRKTGELYAQYGDPSAATPSYAYTNLTQKFYDEFEWYIG